MKTHFKKALIAIVFCLGITSITTAQQDNGHQRKEPPTFAELLKEMDTNEDGKLAKDELKGPLKDDFAKIDTDEDGFISKKEFENAPKPERGKRPSN